MKDVASTVRDLFIQWLPEDLTQLFLYCALYTLNKMDQNYMITIIKISVFPLLFFVFSQ